MANETEVEASLDDISGVDNMLEEGAPLEPQDVADEPEPVTDASPRSSRPWPNAPPTCSGCRPSTSTTSAGSTVTASCVRENATYTALAPIVDVLDTIDRAREHGDLDPGFQAVADQLERVVGQAGLVRFGEPGDPFDPQLHEALSHIGEDPDVEVTTAKVVAKAGYRFGDRVVRAAQVLVVDPAGD